MGGEAKEILFMILLWTLAVLMEAVEEGSEASGAEGDIIAMVMEDMRAASMAEEATAAMDRTEHIERDRQLSTCILPALLVELETEVALMGQGAADSLRQCNSQCRRPARQQIRTMTPGIMEVEEQTHTTALCRNHQRTRDARTRNPHMDLLTVVQ